MTRDVRNLARAQIAPALRGVLWVKLVKCPLSQKNTLESPRCEFLVHDKRVADLYIALQSPVPPMPGPANDGRWDGDNHHAPVSV